MLRQGSIDISSQGNGWRDAKKIEEAFPGLKIRARTDARPREPGLESKTLRYRFLLYIKMARCHLCDHIFLKEGSMLEHVRGAHGWRTSKRRMNWEKDARPRTNGL